MMPTAECPQCSEPVTCFKIDSIPINGWKIEYYRCLKCLAHFEIESFSGGDKFTSVTKKG